MLGCRSEKTPGPVHSLPRSPILRSDHTFLSPFRKEKIRSDTPSHQLRRVGHDAGKSQSKEPERSLPPSGPVAVDPKGCVTIAIHAKPGSKQNAVTDLTAEAINVAIAAPPSEGEANAELCRYLSKVLELRKSDVVLDKGCKSREKVVKLLASTTPEEILEKLKKEAKKT
uniref:UPF0235 protein C15orf40 homolog isoform X1 n=1 Tax=Callithrix jacchus TaxID=9483 RepID=UPI0004F0ABF2|nr:UPF0235 protein C15orf40 homolog isoform X1 [Callithrix jacchus]